MAGAPTPYHPTASPQAVLSLVQQLQQVRDVAAAVLDSVSFSLLGEADAMMVLGMVEDLGRRVDAARVASAADISVRCR
ncbi:hypothetical protein E3O62_04760, partial [Cryobacterium sp. TMT2-15-1]|uniref:hypothetical protein n=1 Tax=Cryobacterium sp. TMT2-15-1 TaxID=1259246 RepID=UPI0010698DDC